MSKLDRALAALDSDRQGALDRLFDLLRLPSISTDPAHVPDCAAAAEWLAGQLREVGFEASVRPTAGHPMVVGKARAARPDAPHVLFYGHYDVQPVDPLELWKAEPFAPAVVEAEPGRSQIVARGAADDKGQLMTFVEACRALHADGGLPCHVTILFEGEEESGSSSLPAFLAANGKELKADLMLVCDTNMWDRDTPLITCMLRGLVLEEVIVKAASRDLHSGMFGGPAVNPIHVLARIVAGLHDDDGRVTLPGFYDGVPELPEEIKAQWAALDFNEAAFLGDVGLSVPAGEANYSVLEQIWARPTCDVNGIVGGYIGEGSKTVLPAQASAKFSFRLVGKQNPQSVIDAFREHVRKSLPEDCEAEFLSHGASPALSLPFRSEAILRASRALEAEWGRPPVLAASGGSIPIVGLFKRELKMDSLMVGFGLDDDRIHSPNEKYELSSFQKGARSWVRILTALAE
ncbi:M20/M25/M40 family metallo-hydrolase [Rhodoblastus acidophilus]|uniref:M20/M25/M40 family metallo-hydrolase n=1 Tax=Candidatus Rhodoblastus alkanivorans TaxID=2954117 RepID=A0ABS9Z9I2_9HYPH|nr:M20/M25/M40 family metallo-hydrolase [Candidatus Rhodoblastus alkanivorans]MCI4679791.1 M20/M25/M40 family metallo-hydrolase [Candidatus Rhodoblastus alkanivorans]MCI4684289.1 M20/M25/M40 family metallo-hydrolase [Candidatus Rhodoblastus alkanivorans]MDI4641609.1 M20/M25/M40 family metallo-hydrolase [Rhodoblastus acidophilus]